MLEHNPIKPSVVHPDDLPDGRPPHFDELTRGSASIVTREGGEVVIFDPEGNMTPLDPAGGS